MKYKHWFSLFLKCLTSAQSGALKIHIVEYGGSHSCSWLPQASRHRFVSARRERWRRDSCCDGKASMHFWNAKMLILIIFSLSSAYFEYGIFLQVKMYFTFCVLTYMCVSLCLCVYMFVCILALVLVCGSEDNLWNLFLSLCHLGSWRSNSGRSNLEIQLCSMCLYISLTWRDDFVNNSPLSWHCFLWPTDPKVKLY